MSVESWARRTSGLLVPRMGFAAPWRWQCWGCGCFAPKTCGDYFTGSEPTGFFADVPAFANGTCSTCANFAGTVWAPSFGDACTCVGGSDYICGAMRQVGITIGTDGGGPHVAAILIGAYTPQWRLDLTAPLPDPVDVTLLFVSQAGGHCDATGMGLRIYEP